MPAGEVRRPWGRQYKCRLWRRKPDNRASPEGKQANLAMLEEMHSPFGGWRHHLVRLVRWEACHWIRGSRGSPMNPVPLPPPQFGGAVKGKRLNGQARRLTSPHLEVLCRTSTGDYKAPLCCELLMKGLLFRALFCPPEQGEVRRSRIGGGEPIRRMVILPYDADRLIRNADFISIARRAIHNPRGQRPRQTLEPSGRQAGQS